MWGFRRTGVNKGRGDKGQQGTGDTGQQGVDKGQHGVWGVLGGQRSTGDGKDTGGGGGLHESATVWGGGGGRVLGGKGCTVAEIDWSRIAQMAITSKIIVYQAVKWR